MQKASKMGTIQKDRKGIDWYAKEEDRDRLPGHAGNGEEECEVVGPWTN
jgi:hypothetical protein